MVGRLLQLMIVLLTSGAHAALPDSAIFAAEDLEYCQVSPNASVQSLRGEDLPDDGAVWRVGSNRWNEDWETQYANFITNNVNPDFMEELQIATDCTDAVITIRAIFARIHSLPFVLLDQNQRLRFDSTAFKNSPTVTDWTEENWKENLKKDLRFNLFLTQIKNDIGSVNLPESEYPKRIHSLTDPTQLSESILPGTIFQYPEHTSFLARLNASDPYFPLTEYSSTSGEIVRMLNVYSTPMIRNAAPERGVVGFRWPVNCGGGFVLAPEKNMPDYSLEQYSLDLNGLSLGSYLESIAPGTRTAPDQHLVSLKLREIKAMIIRRLDLISESNALLAKNKNAFKSKITTIYQQYSTNDLDVAIFDQFSDLEKRIESNSDLISYYQNLLNKVLFIKISDSLTIPYESFRNSLFAQYEKDGNKIASPQIVGADPNDSVEKRWGLSH